jgi:hypothetical protein
MNFGDDDDDMLDEALLDLRSNSCTELDITDTTDFFGQMDVLADALLANSTVTVLCLCAYGLYSREQAASFVAADCPFLEYLATSQSLQEVEFCNSSGANYCQKIFAHQLRAIGQNPNIQYLSFSEAVPLQPLCDVMARTVSIIDLSMEIPDDVEPEMTDSLQDAVDAFASNTTLETLGLTGLGANSLVFLDPLLGSLAGRHPRLEYLFLTTTIVPSDGWDCSKQSCAIVGDLEPCGRLGLFETIRCNSRLCRN